MDGLLVVFFGAHGFPVNFINRIALFVDFDLVQCGGDQIDIQLVRCTDQINQDIRQFQAYILLIRM